MRVFTGPEDLQETAGQEIGVSDWLEVGQPRIDTFAEAAGDHQWIHVDVERAKRGPFGATIAHGYLTLALLVPLMKMVFRVDGTRMAVNYGLNKVRFPAPVRSGSRVRVRVRLAAVEPVAGGVQVTFHNTVEQDGQDKPACVAESIARYYF
jgi:acyl dehydratase